MLQIPHIDPEIHMEEIQVHELCPDPFLQDPGRTLSGLRKGPAKLLHGPGLGFKLPGCQRCQLFIVFQLLKAFSLFLQAF